MQLLHAEVLDPLHTLLAIALELPEDYFRNIHKYEAKSEDHLRYMRYTKYTPEENAAVGNWVHGHTGTRFLANFDTLIYHFAFADLGSFTLLFRQPIAALQIRDPVHNQWKWVKPQDATLTTNACDAISFLTGGYVRSTVHRCVVQPIRNVSIFSLTSTHPQRRRASEGSATCRPPWAALLFSVYNQAHLIV
jgi:isopenicillin N synthase-like dioxygenase